MMYWHKLVLLMMSTCCSEHVEAWNKYIEKECVKLVISQKYVEMHGQQNIKLNEFHNESYFSATQLHYFLPYIYNNLHVKECLPYLTDIPILRQTVPHCLLPTSHCSGPGSIPQQSVLILWEDKEAMRLRFFEHFSLHLPILSLPMFYNHLSSWLVQYTHLRLQ